MADVSLKPHFRYVIQSICLIQCHTRAPVTLISSACLTNHFFIDWICCFPVAPRTLHQTVFQPAIQQYRRFPLCDFTHCHILSYSYYLKKRLFCLFPFDLCFTSGAYYDLDNEKIILGILLLLQE